MSRLQCGGEVDPARRRRRGGAARPNIAYFPSYDLVNVSPNAARFYREDTRRINSHGIDRTMKMFFDHFTDRARRRRRSARSRTTWRARPKPTPSLDEEASNRPRVLTLSQAEVAVEPGKSATSLVALSPQAGKGNFH